MPPEYRITPSVDQINTFMEIATNFANPLELVREAISNSYDADACNIEVIFDVVEFDGRDSLRIRIIDDGAGMTQDGLQSFFDLGNSTRRNDPQKIGEKGHGTKVFLNCRTIRVKTLSEGKKLVATLHDPLAALRTRRVPEVTVSEEIAQENEQSGTEIEILGYNHDQRGVFTHDRIKDYVLWFTKHGSIESIFGAPRRSVSLRLKGLDRDQPEDILAGHIFPDENADLARLLDEHIVRAPDYYCKRLVFSGSLPNHPEKHYDAVFSVEGTHVKYRFNNMLRHSGYNPPRGAYTVQERYGLWLCKDYIPVQRKNEWITTKGTEYTKFHAFFNCQALHLTANRGSIENTPADIMDDIQSEVRRIYSEIVEGDDWRNIDFLESEASGYRTMEKERKDFIWRRQRVNESRVASIDGHILVEPRHESGVHAMFVQLSVLHPDLFPFTILDYDTHEGIDLVVKSDRTTAITAARLFYVELKHTLTNDFNHCFENIYSIVCWDTVLRHDDTITDISGENRQMRIVPPENDGQGNRYFLENQHKPLRIEVYVLKEYLRAKLGLEFQPRTERAVE